MWALWLVCLPAIIGALALQHVSTLQVHGISSIQAAAVVVFLWLTLAWLWPDRSRRDLMVAVTAALAFVVAGVTHLVLGLDPLVAARVAAAMVVQAAVTLALYRWRIGDDNLTPHRPGRPRRPVRGQPGRRGRGAADGPGAGTLGDQPRVRPASGGSPWAPPTSSSAAPA